MTLPSPPPIPPWEALHVLVVHLPIGLLLVAPLFVLLATLARRWAGWTALLLLVVGTVGAWAAVYTGEAARDVVEDGPDEMWSILEKHEDLAIQARNAFTVATVIYAVMLALPLLSRKIGQAAVWIPLNLVYLAALMLAVLLLADAAHQGGHLVHVYGVHAALGVEPAPAAETEDAESTSDSSADSDTPEAKPSDDEAPAKTTTEPVAPDDAKPTEASKE